VTAQYASRSAETTESAALAAASLQRHQGQLETARAEITAAEQRVEDARLRVAAAERRLHQLQELLAQKRAVSVPEALSKAEQDVKQCTAALAQRQQDLDEIISRARDIALLVAAYVRAEAA
jgi:chromosome segregation ATPase